MKRISLLAVPLLALGLLLGLLAGCGSDDSSGAAADEGGMATNASVEEFCGAFLDLIQQAQEAGSEISDADAIKLAKDLAEKLEEIGTPEDMPADARRAFETAIQKINDLPDDATRDEMDEAAADLTDEEKKDQEALSTYLTKTCMGQLVPSGDASSGS
jgi:hypothetical protein